MDKILPPFFQRNQFYIISGIIFLVWIIIFDRSNLITQAKMILDLRKLENEKAYYQEQLKDLKVEESQIMGSEKSLEKFAREKYLMRKTGETVFVLVDKNDKVIEEKE